MRHQPFILLSFSSSKKLRKSQETQSYQRFQCIGHTDFKGLSNAVTNTHPLLPSMLTNGPRSLSRAKAGTHSAFGEGSHTATHTAKHGAFRMVVGSLPSDRSTRSPTSPGRVSERHTLPLLGLGRGCSRRTQRASGTAMRLCASLSRGVAAPLGCVIFSVSVEIYGFTPRTQGFLCVRGGGGITTPGALYVLLKRRTAACKSG